MADRAGLAADTYRIPTPPPYQAMGGATQAGAQPFDDQLQFQQGLQQVDGVTDKYYEKVAALKSFMADVHRNMGIDVRVPDTAHPESVKLNRIYKKALADIMAQGNKLHVGESERAMNIQRGVQYTGSAKGKADSEMQPGVDFYEHSVPNSIIEINNKLQQPSYDDQDYQQKQEIHKKAVEHLDELKKLYPEKSEQYDFWKSALTPPSQAIKQFAPQRQSYQERAAGRKREAAGNILKEITNLKHGVADGYRISDTTSNPHNPESPLMVRPNFQAAKWNGKAIKEWGYDPQSKESFLFFDDGTAEDITDQNPMSIARVMMGENKATFGVDAEYMDEWADQKGMLNDDGSVNEAALLRKDFEKKQDEYATAHMESRTSSEIAGLGAKLKKIQEGASHYLGTRSSGTISLPGNPNPALIKKAKLSEKLYIDNFAQLFPKPGKTDKKGQERWMKEAKQYGPEGDGVDWDDMRTYLQKFGASKNAEAATVNSGQPATQAIKETMQDRINRLKREAGK